MHAVASMFFNGSSSKKFAKLLYFCSTRCRILNCDRNLHLNQLSCVQSKYTVQILPEVNELIEGGEMKHRKHPGKRTKAPIALPETLVNAAYRLIPDEMERLVLEEAETLCSNLRSRRLPIEPEEIQYRVRKMYPNFDEQFKDVCEPDKKEIFIELRKKLRTELNRWKDIEYNHQQCLAYLAGRFSANYSSLLKVFYEMKEKIPSFQPERVFDFGSGVGSSVWATHSEWGESIKEYFCVDASSEMNDIAYSLLQDEAADDMHIKPVFFRQFLPASETIKYDLVISAFSLMDLPGFTERLRVIDTLWRKTKDILVIIEDGNYAGFSIVLYARDYILKMENESSNPEYSSGAEVICPCPHDSDCPRIADRLKKPCGFYVSYESLFPRHYAKCVKKGWISYVVLRKGRRSQDQVDLPRLVKPVLKRKRKVLCGLCCSDGKLHNIVVTRGRHGRNAYRCARSSDIGDVLPVTVRELTDGTPGDTETFSDSELEAADRSSV